jgi:hypothetical protein
MMSAISEAWTIMNKHMEMKYDDIGKVFEKWSSEGELVSGPPLKRRNFLTASEKHLLSQDWGRYMRAEGQEREPCPR